MILQAQDGLKSSSLRPIGLFASVRTIVKFLCSGDCGIDAVVVTFIVWAMPASVIATVTAPTQEVRREYHQSVFKVVIQPIHKRRLGLLA